MKRRWFVPGMAVFVALMAPTAFGAGLARPSAPAAGTTPRIPSIAPRVAGASGFGYVQTAAYRHQKALIDAAAAARGSGGVAPARPAAAAPPTIGASFQGPDDALVSPSDSVGAVGPTRFVTLVNEQYAIYNRTTPVPVQLSSGPLSSFTTVSADQFGLFDPQIMWDPGTQRFFYVMDDIVCGSFSCSGEDYRLAWGFSTTDSPNTPQDWCHYQADFGIYGTSANFPDYPKLGDTKDFILIGTNVYPHLQTFLGSDVDWISKPPAGSTCPAQDSFKTGSVQNVQNQDGTTAFTPVPVNQVDDSSTGYVVANTDLGDPGDPGAPATGPSTGTALTVFTVTKNPDGTANIPQKGTTLTVPAYSMPPSAPQSGTANTLDTLDGRLTQAMSSVNPKNGKTYIYTEHTVAGGAGSVVRWYRVDPAKMRRKVHTISDPALYVFNGAVSTDRAVTPTGATFGGSVVVGFDTSSGSTLEAIQMLSNVPGQGNSAFVLVHQSDAADNDFTCTPCRWGDYAAAGPDPAADPTKPHGSVWLTSMASSTGDPVLHAHFWRTWDWQANI